MNHNLYLLLEERFSTQPNKPCMLDEQGKVLLTYAEIQTQSAEIAAVLVANGMRKGDRLLAQIDKTPLGVSLYLACLRKGFVYIPLNTAYTNSELEYFLEDSQARLLVCAPDRQQTLTPLADAQGIAQVFTSDGNGQGSLLAQCAHHQPDTGIEQVDENEIAAILYTSGTTGAAKGAMLSHKNLSSNLQTLHGLWGWKSDDILLHALPIFHAHGLFVGVNLSLYNASPMIFLPKFRVDPVLDALPSATVFMGVPTFYSRMFASERLSEELCSNIRLFLSGSAPLRPEHFNAFRERTGHSILERYGMTEAGMICSNPLDGERLAGTVGYPLPGVSARVVGKHRELLAPGEIGQLQINGPNVFRGYWRKPQKTLEDLTDDGYFITGDLAMKSVDGRITIVGRDKDLIISGGFNVYPSEIEARIMEVSGVEDTAVFGLPHPDFGECVTAVIVQAPYATVSEAAIKAHLRSVLADFKQPKLILFNEAIPRNAMGKIEKAVLRERHKNSFINAK